MKIHVAFVLCLAGVMSSSAYAQDALTVAKNMLDSIEGLGYAVQQRRLCGLQDNQMPEHQRAYNAGLWWAQTIAAFPNTPDNAVLQAMLTPSAVEATFSGGAARANREPHPTAAMCAEARQKLTNGEAFAKRAADDTNARTKMVRQANHLR